VVDEEKMNNNADKLRSYTQPPTASADQTVEEEQKHSKAREAKQSLKEQKKKAVNSEEDTRPSVGVPSQHP
jgi:hypothetical protein